MKTQITLVRHGVTDWNYDGRAQGHSDIPLNAEGRRQAEAVASRLSTELWDAVYSSDLSRSLSTAQAICRRTGHEVIIEPRLRERNIGLAEGTTESERQLRWPGVPWNSLPGLETNEQLARRAVEVLTEIARRHRGQRVIVVSHGGLIAAFLREISGGMGHVGIPRNTGITPVIYDGQRFSQSAPQEFRHLLVDGVEYTGEKGRVVFEGNRSGLPGVRLALHEVEPFILNAAAVESAWVEDRLVGYARAFTDKVRYGYIDLIHTLPEFQRVRPMLLLRLEERFPTVRFEILTGRMEERSGA
ncbi:MAG: histidine phosphatase family protein [Bacillota bacterium]